jgi:hypothetical protein
MSMNSRTQIAIICFLCLITAGCKRTVHVTEQMTWECAPDEYNSAYYAKPDEYVRFRFVRNPHREEVESSRNFCAEMREAGKAVVNVDFELWGSSHNLRGYRMTSVDGRPFQDIGGWAHSGANDYSGPSPLDEAFAK